MCSTFFFILAHAYVIHRVWPQPLHYTASTAIWNYQSTLGLPSIPHSCSTSSIQSSVLSSLPPRALSQKAFQASSKQVTHGCLNPTHLRCCIEFIHQRRLSRLMGKTMEGFCWLSMGSCLMLPLAGISMDRVSFFLTLGVVYNIELVVLWDGMYGNFAGRDASRGMAKQSFDLGRAYIRTSSLRSFV